MSRTFTAQSLLLEEIDAQIKEQRALLNRLKDKKKEAEKSTNDASRRRIRELEEKIKTLEANKQEEERADFSNAVRVKELEAKIKTLENQKRDEKQKPPNPARPWNS